MKKSNPKDIFRAQSATIIECLELSDSISIGVFNARVGSALETIRELSDPHYAFDLTATFPEVVVPGWRQKTSADEIEEISYYSRGEHGQLTFEKRASRSIRGWSLPVVSIEMVGGREVPYLSGRGIALQAGSKPVDEHAIKDGMPLELFGGPLLVAPTAHRPILTATVKSA